jgi:7-keto-8-aminopelargonate synthetase-like enzyme
MGRGAEGVRGEKQAKHMAMTGSGRIRKVAVGLEQPLVQVAEKGIKLIQRNSTKRMRTDKGMTLLPSQVADPSLKIRVAGHSHSPLFADESKEQAAGLFKSQAIDREMLVRMLNPPNADAIIHRLRKRVMAEQAQAEADRKAGHPPGKPQHPTAA